MNQEERRQKRQNETKTARLVFVVMILAFFVAVAGAVFGLRQFLIKDAGEENGGVLADADTESTEMSDTGAQEPPADTGQAAPPVAEDPLYQQALSTVSGMTTEEKVAQLFFITPDSLTGYTNANVAGDTTKNIYQEYPVGGIIYMSGNLQNTDQTKTMLGKMMDIAKERTGLPLLLGVDEEGGSVARIAGNPEFQIQNVGDMSAIGATGDAQKAHEVGTTIGAYLKGFGFNVNFAPVADVLTNPENTVIGNRSFGSDSQVVAGMVTSELVGLSEQGIFGAVKHFPGQGGTAGDSHEGAVTLEKTVDELLAEELVPFQHAIDAGVQIIMVSHMSLPNVTGDNTPASLSAKVMTDLLRGRMGYQGIIITDALNMGAVTASYSSEQAAVAAIGAGADMVLMPQDFKAAYQGVLDALANGTLSEERINDAAAHVVKLKQQIQTAAQ